MKNKYIILAIIAILFVCSACNKEWTEEQYAPYISFKAPITTGGVSQIFVRYKEAGKVTYQLPVLLSGTTTLSSPVNVQIGVDNDTLDILNVERFHSRTDLFYQMLKPEYYEIPSSEVTIPAGECGSLLDIDFKLKDLDLVDKWVLPLTILDAPDYGYQPNMRKHYRKALLYVTPFNDYSGSYSTTTMSVYFRQGSGDPMVTNNRTAFVVDNNTVFFYAGVTDEQRKDRRAFKIFVKFNKDGTLTLEQEDPQLNLRVIGTPTYEIEETMDVDKPYLKHRYITLTLEYEYDDTLEVPNYTVKYRAKGIMTMERKINTQIPDEDQAILW